MNKIFPIYPKKTPVCAIVKIFSNIGINRAPYSRTRIKLSMLWSTCLIKNPFIFCGFIRSPRFVFFNALVLFAVALKLNTTIFYCFSTEIKSKQPASSKQKRYTQMEFWNFTCYYLVALIKSFAFYAKHAMEMELSGFYATMISDKNGLV